MNLKKYIAEQSKNWFVLINEFERVGPRRLTWCCGTSDVCCIKLRDIAPRFEGQMEHNFMDKKKAHTSELNLFIDVSPNTQRVRYSKMHTFLKGALACTVLLFFLKNLAIFDEKIESLCFFLI